MKTNNDYEQAQQQAEANYADLKERGNDALGETWEDLERELFTPEEIEESHLRASLINTMISVRKEQGITQQQLEELSGVRQPVIARMESGASNPRIDTLLKVLVSLGKTLAIIPLEQ